AALLTAAANVRDVAPPADGPLRVRVVVAFVETQVLLDVGGCAHDPRIEQRADAFLVGPVRRSEGNADGNPGAVGEMMALGPALRGGGGLRPLFFPHGGGFWKPPHPGPPTASPDPHRDHSPATGASRWPRSTRHRPSAGIADGPWGPPQTPAG